MHKENNNELVSEYNVDYRNGDVRETRIEGIYNASEGVRHVEHVDFRPRYSPNHKNKAYSVRPQPVVKPVVRTDEIGVNKSRVVLASIILVLVIASVAVVVTLANPNFSVDMTMLGNL